MSQNILESSTEYISPGSNRVYVIGDLHGCFLETEALLSHLVSSCNLTADDIVLFLGDYIDRGPASCQLISMLLNFKKAYPRTCFLKGNHEDMFLDFMGITGGSRGDIFLENGGYETLASYDYHDDEGYFDPKKHLAKGHLEFFTDLKLSARIGDVICVHAGLNPYKDLASQAEEDILWIRDEFVFNPHNFDLIVVFGHTPQRDILWDLPYKIGLDTGLVFGNSLSCLELQEGVIYQVKSGSKKVESWSTKIG